MSNFRVQDADALLLYRVGPVYVCSPTMQVEAVVQPPKFNVPPGANSSEPGVFKSLHGMVRVVDLRVRFGVDEADREKNGRIIIAEVEGGHAGFWVDEIEDVVRFPEQGWGQVPTHIPRSVFSRTLSSNQLIRLYAEFEALDKFKSHGYLRKHIEQIKRAEESVRKEEDIHKGIGQKHDRKPGQKPDLKPDLKSGLKDDVESVSKHDKQVSESEKLAHYVDEEKKLHDKPIAHKTDVFTYSSAKVPESKHGDRIHAGEVIDGRIAGTEDVMKSAETKVPPQSHRPAHPSIVSERNKGKRVSKPEFKPAVQSSVQTDAAASRAQHRSGLQSRHQAAKPLRSASVHSSSGGTVSSARVHKGTESVQPKAAFSTGVTSAPPSVDRRQEDVRARSVESKQEKQALGVWLWLLPALLIVPLLVYFMMDGSDSSDRVRLMSLPEKLEVKKLPVQEEVEVVDASEIGALEDSQEEQLIERIQAEPDDYESKETQIAEVEEGYVEISQQENDIVIIVNEYEEIQQTTTIDESAQEELYARIEKEETVEEEFVAGVDKASAVERGVDEEGKQQTDITRVENDNIEALETEIVETEIAGIVEQIAVDDSDDQQEQAEYAGERPFDSAGRDEIMDEDLHQQKEQIIADSGVSVEEVGATTKTPEDVEARTAVQEMVNPESGEKGVEIKQPSIETREPETLKQVDATRPAVASSSKEAGEAVVVEVASEKDKVKSSYVETRVHAQKDQISHEPKAVIKRRPLNGTRKHIHVVVKGDTLWNIAEHYVKNPWRYPELARLSKIRNPDLIYPGQKIIIILNYKQPAQ